MIGKESWVRCMLRRACVSREERQEMRGPRAAYGSPAKGSVVAVWTEERGRLSKSDEDRETCELACTVSWERGWGKKGSR